MIHHVYANQSNVGDWLSARGIQSRLAPLRVTEHFCDAPFVPDTLRELSKATEKDFIILGGGGLFMDYFVPFWEGFREIAERVPFVIWGAGCCDMKREKTRAPAALLENIIRRSRLCVVRDALTRGLLGGCVMAEPVPCPTMVAVPSADSVARGLLHVDHYDNVGAKIYEEMVAVSERFAEETGRSYRQTNNLIPAGHEGALQKTLGLYAAADLIVTSRLHGCIIALAMGRRVLVVSADHKVESFMQAAELSDWVIGLEELESLPTRLRELQKQPPRPAFVEEVRAKNGAVAEKVRSLIASVASKGTPA